jgi:hypothetical protein
MCQDGRYARLSGVNIPTVSEFDQFQASRFQNSIESFRCSDVPIGHVEEFASLDSGENRPQWKCVVMSS